MTFKDFIDTDRKLYYSIQCCEKVIDNPETDVGIRIIALAERSVLSNEREELYKIMDYRRLLKTYEDEDTD